jgi:excisionase family DNA binding protein
MRGDLPESELLKVDEVAEYLRVSSKTVYLWVDHGLLEAEKLKGTIRILRKSVLNFRLNSRLRPFE